MAAPSYVDAGTGATDAGGVWSYTCQAPAAAGRVIVVQILQDGASTGVVAVTGNSNINNLAGSAGWTTVVAEAPVGASSEALQSIFIGRATSTSAPTISGTNSTSEDLYIRSYQFTDVSTGTTLATVIENGAAQVDQQTGTTSYFFGQATGAEFAAQSFVAAGPIGSVLLGLGAFSTPTDNVVVELQSDSAGAPSGSVLASASRPASDVTGGDGILTFPISYAAVAGTTYWIVAHRSGSLSDANYYRWYITAATNPYTGGTSAHKDAGGAWTNDTSRDRYFAVYGGTGYAANSVGTDNTATDAGVTTLGPDRLALNFVAINDDDAISAFTGETGGDWTLAVSPYAESSGTDGAIGLQIANPNITFLADDASAHDVYGGTGTQEMQAQSFVPSANCTLYGVDLVLAKFNSPVDTTIVEIQTDNAGNPSGSVIASASVSSATLGAKATVPFSLSSTALTGAQKYWIVLSRSVRDTTNRIGWYQSSVAIAGTGWNQRSSGAWSGESSTDLAFAVHLATTINGGSENHVDSDAWGVVGFALIGTTVAGPTYQPRHAETFHDFR